MFRMILLTLATAIAASANAAGQSSVVPARQIVKDEPTPVPIEVEVLPMAAITVTDSNGVPITDEVAPGTQIVISAEKAVRGTKSGSIAWRVTPKMQTTHFPDQTAMIVTTPRDDALICILQMVALGDKISFQEIIIKCGKGPQPPPGPNPPVPLPPGPNPPAPTAKKLFWAVVETGPRTDSTQLVMNAIGIWEKFRENGDDWRFYKPGSTESKGVKALADATASGTTFPALVLYNLDTMTKLTAIPLPKTIDELKAVRPQFSGGN